MERNEEVGARWLDLLSLLRGTPPSDSSAVGGLTTMSTMMASAQWRAQPRSRTRQQGRHRNRNRCHAVSSASNESTKNTKPAEVFLACIPLVGLEAFGTMLGDNYPTQLEHVMVLVRGVEGGGKTPVVVCYDFLPIDPLAPTTAAALLGGGEVPGDLRVRPLRGVPSRRCWHVGTSTGSIRVDSTTSEIESTSASTELETKNIDVHADARDFQKRYPSKLSLFGDQKNTCVEHAEALITHLTGNTIKYEEWIRTKPNANAN